ncbi:MAG: hypothetical protein K9L62_16535 [Vallitaleaceae bacterium]|nr:hypothetical protein [Vallitaleaceae bacterium]
MKEYNKTMRTNQGAYAVHVVDEVNDINYIYIGSGFLGDRVSGNVSKLKRVGHANKKLQDAYNKFGNVKVEILDVIDRCENEKIVARESEADWIKHFRRVDGVVVCNTDKPTVTSEPYARKLDEYKVREIKARLTSGEKLKDIANYYGVKVALISKIKTGLRWAYIE